MNFRNLQQRALASPMANARDARGDQIRVGSELFETFGDRWAIALSVNK